MSYQDSRLWKHAFGPTERSLAEDELRERGRLKEAYELFREHAKTLAAEISRDLPSLTVHDISHIDALWEMADLILLGKESSGHEPDLNPVEVFVLGCSFLTHDLAHSKAALDLSANQIESDSLYRDIVAGIVKARLEQASGSPEPTAEERDKALAQFLREKHASAAETLPFRQWKYKASTIFLLEDDELRQHLGEAIGKVAASHHWPVNALGQAFEDKIGGPPFLPYTSCDLLRVSCLMRLADGAHIDSRRAPSLLQALRNPEGEALNHWDFQNHILRPLAKGDHIVYTSSTSFPESEIDAWWLCFDTLAYFDRQLSSVDALLTDLGRSRFQIRAVAGIEDPRRLSKLIHTKDWIPVDTQIRVGNVASLVLRLGGSQLYGDDLTVPLRELIQNSGDAILARRAIDPYFSGGLIRVSLTCEQSVWRLRVSDDGVGMSEYVLTGALIDFGASFWKSPEARREFPGLTQSQFSSTGRYGIGFFSVFMLGDDVSVTSRRFNETSQGAKTLHFRHGAESRPVLSDAGSDLRHMVGTTISIQLRQAPYSSGGLVNTDEIAATHDLAELCSWLCPTFPVTIAVSIDGETYSNVVVANDWKTLAPERLLARLIKSADPRDERQIQDFISLHAPTLSDVKGKDGELLGRATAMMSWLGMYHRESPEMTVTVGGCRCASMHRIVGVLLGKSKRAARDKATFLGTREDIDRWARALAEDLAKRGEINHVLQHASIFDGCGVERDDIELAKSAKGNLNKKGLIGFAKKHNTILVVDRNSEYELSHNRNLTYLPPVLVMETMLMDLFEDLFESSPCTGRSRWGAIGDDSHFAIMATQAFASIAEAWGVSLNALRASAIPEIKQERLTPKKVATDEHGADIRTSEYFILRRQKAEEYERAQTA